jgi:hypothetical protein
MSPTWQHSVVHESTFPSFTKKIATLALKPVRGPSDGYPVLLSMLIDDVKDGNVVQYPREYNTKSTQSDPGKSAGGSGRTCGMPLQDFEE